MQGVPGDAAGGGNPYRLSRRWWRRGGAGKARVDRQLSGDGRNSAADCCGNRVVVAGRNSKRAAGRRGSSQNERPGAVSGRCHAVSSAANVNRQGLSGGEARHAGQGRRQRMRSDRVDGWIDLDRTGGRGHRGASTRFHDLGCDIGRHPRAQGERTTGRTRRAQIERPGAVSGRRDGIGGPGNRDLQRLPGKQAGRAGNRGLGGVGFQAGQAESAKGNVDMRRASGNRRQSRAADGSRDIETGIGLDRMRAGGLDGEQIVGVGIAGDGREFDFAGKSPRITQDNVIEGGSSDRIEFNLAGIEIERAACRCVDHAQRHAGTEGGVLDLDPGIERGHTNGAVG